MKLSLLFLPALLLPSPSDAARMSCKKEVGNLCYRIDGRTPTTRERIDRSPSFQRALEAMAEKMRGTGTVYIVQGYRTPEYQRRLCGGHYRTGCASPRSSRHVISIAADPMVPGNVPKQLCYAENQARVEFLGPRSAAAVYGYDPKNRHTWGHIDDSTGTNYTPRACGRNEGLNASIPRARNPEPGAAQSPVVKKFKEQRAAEPRRPAAAARPRPVASPAPARRPSGPGKQADHEEDWRELLARAFRDGA